MQQLVLDVPLMYADHHVLRVRSLLQAIPGVAALDASSAFQRLTIHYNPAHVSAEALLSALREAGYVAQDGEMPVVLPQASGRGDPAWERQSTRVARTRSAHTT